MVSGDQTDATITVRMPAQAFPSGVDLRGATVFVSVFDWDGFSNDYRSIAADPADFVFGGGAPNDPKIMDSVILTLPQ